MPHSLAIKDTLNQAYRKQKVRKRELEHFTAQLSQLLRRVKSRRRTLKTCCLTF